MDNDTLVNAVRVAKWWRLGCAGRVARKGKMSNVYSILVGRSGGKRPPESSRRTWSDIIKMDLKNIKCESVDWIQVTIGSSGGHT
jgi:hypothetical protein